MKLSEPSVCSFPQIYCDDLLSWSDDVESAYDIYAKSKLCLAVAGFKLRKFISNYDGLHHRIQKNEQISEGQRSWKKTKYEKFEITLSQIIDSQEKKGPAHEQKDLSYAKSSLRTRMDEKLGVHKHHGGFGNYQTECCQHHSKVL